MDELHVHPQDRGRRQWDIGRVGQFGRGGDPADHASPVHHHQEGGLSRLSGLADRFPNPRLHAHSGRAAVPLVFAGTNLESYNKEPDLSTYTSVVGVTLIHLPDFAGGFRPERNLLVIRQGVVTRAWGSENVPEF